MNLHLRAVAACALGCLCVGEVFAEDPRAWIKADDHLKSLVQLYQEFHRNPELSLKEEKTAARYADELRKVGAEVTAGVGGYGVVGLMKNGPGPTVMVRCDLDALPVVEDTGLPYASKVRTKTDDGQDVGVMHACGHDIHITSAIGVARYLASNKSAWSGTVMFIGQPAEEAGAGAQLMLAAGLFKKFPRPDFGLALHCDQRFPTGKIGCRPGYTHANVDSVDITMRGRGGHGARPDTAIDPIVMAAQLILDLQTIISREKDPTEPGVVTVGSIHGGTKHNIIPDSCHLKLTVRSTTDTTRQKILASIKRKAFAVAASAGAQDPIVEYSDGTPAVYNDDRLVERLEPVFRKTLGDENVVRIEQTMGGEDFSEYGLAGVPICMFRVGSLLPARWDELHKDGKSPPSLHSSKYSPDAPETLETGIVAMSAAVLDLLPKK